MFFYIFPCSHHPCFIHSIPHSSHVSFNPFILPRFQYTPANYDCQVFLTIFINMMKIIKIPFYLAIGFMVLTLSPILLIKSIFQ